MNFTSIRTGLFSSRSAKKICSQGRCLAYLGVLTTITLAINDPSVGIGVALGGKNLDLGLRTTNGVIINPVKMKQIV